MKIKTRHFGEIEIDENQIIYFKEGIPSFEDQKRFVIINNTDPEVPFKWLQGVDDSQLAFVIVNPFLFYEEYEFDIPDKTIQKLEIEEKEDILVYSIVVVPENIKDMTINLQAPIIINNKKRKAKQIILDVEQYPIRYYLFKPINIYGGEE